MSWDEAFANFNTLEPMNSNAHIISIFTDYSMLHRELDYSQNDAKDQGFLLKNYMLWIFFLPNLH